MTLRARTQIPSRMVARIGTRQSVSRRKDSSAKALHRSTDMDVYSVQNTRVILAALRGGMTHVVFGRRSRRPGEGIGAVARRKPGSTSPSAGSKIGM